MSLGCGIGDVIAVTKIASDLYDRFKNAPGQFKDLWEDLKSLQSVLEDIHQKLPDSDSIQSLQEKKLDAAIGGCRNVLLDVKEKLEKSNPNDIGRNKLRRLWKRFHWDQEIIRDFHRRLHLQYTTLNMLLTHMTRDTVAQLTAKVDDIQSHGHAQERRQYNERLADWFSTIDFATQQCDFISRRQEGTGEWFLSSEEYQEWISQPGKVLLCPGDPGAGKTILASVIIEAVQRRCWTNASEGVAFLYLSYQPQQRTTAKELLGCLVRQLVQTSEAVPPEIEKLFKDHDRNKSLPSMAETSKALAAAVVARSRVFIIVDALDEYHSSTPSETNSFLSAILRLQQQTSFSLLATSRRIPDIMMHFKNSLSRIVRANDDDLRAYIESKTACLLEWKIAEDPGLQDMVREMVFTAADGMFLHVELLMKSLNEKATKGTLKQALRDLPHGSLGLEKLYDQAMARIDSQPEESRELARATLTWLVHAKRALSKGALLDALAIRLETKELDRDFRPTLDTLSSSCAGLIRYDEQTNVVRLVHKTTEEYFKRKSLFPDGHAMIAEACTTYLAFDHFSAGPWSQQGYQESITLYPLYRYAADYWAEHANMSNPIADQILAFLRGPAANLSACMYTRRIPGSTKGVHVAAYFGLNQSMEVLIQDGQSPDTQDANGDTPLFYAVDNRQVKTTTLLLRKYHVDPNRTDASGFTALDTATLLGSLELVRELLADPRIDPNRCGNELQTTPLIYALQESYTQIAELLLLHDKIDVGVVSYDEIHFGVSALAVACGKEDRAMVTLLLAKDGIDNYLRSEHAIEALRAAAYGKDEEIFMMVLDKYSSDIDLKDDCGRTLLFDVASGGHTSILIHLVTECGADPKFKDKRGNSPIFEAIDAGNEDIVDLLITPYGIHPQEQNDEGYTLCACSAVRGQTGVLELLVTSHNADPNAPGSSGRTPFMWTVLWNETDMLDLLYTKYHVDIEAQDLEGCTALSHAAQFAKYSTLELLLTKFGAKPNIPDKFGRTPFMHAARKGRKDVLELLFTQYDADARTPDSEGHTPLWHVADGYLYDQDPWCPRNSDRPKKFKATFEWFSTNVNITWDPKSPCHPEANEAVRSLLGLMPSWVHSGYNLGFKSRTADSV